MSDNSNLKRNIRSNLELKETEELIEIWSENNRGAWTDEAFDVVKSILFERLGEIPDQDEPVNYIEDDAEEETEEDELKAVSTGVENPPEFYNPSDVLRYEKWVNTAAVMGVIVVFISLLFELPALRNIYGTQFVFFHNSVLDYVFQWLLVIIAYPILAVIKSVLILIPLKALALILRILMKMEFKSRGVIMD